MRIVPQEDVLLRVMGNEAVLLNLKTETYYMLNSTGIRMWELLTTCESVDAAIHQLSEEYDVTLAELHDDVNQLIQGLSAAQLIHTQP